MPLLKYRCNQCDHIFDELVSSSEEKVACPVCKSKDTQRAYVGKCLFGKTAGNGGGGCSGSCAGCHGCH